MNEQTVILAVEIILGVALGTGTTVIIGGGLYDIRTLARWPRLTRAERRLSKPRQPQVSVLVLARRDTVITPCLKAIRRSRYHAVDVVVIDNMIHGSARQEVKDFQRRYPAVSLRLFAKRKKSSRIEALRQGYSRSGRGEFVVVIDASMLLSPAAIKRAVARFQLDERLQQIRFNDAMPTTGTTLGIYAQLLKASQSTVQKAGTLVFRKQPLATTAPLVCRASVLKMHGRLRSDYDRSVGITRTIKGDVVLAYALVAPFSGGTRLGWAAVAMTLLFAQSYALYAAASLKSASLLMLAWFGLTAWCLAITWGGDTKSERLAVILVAPLTYVLLGVHMVAGLVVLFWTFARSIYVGLGKFITEFFARNLLRHS